MTAASEMRAVLRALASRTEQATWDDLWFALAREQREQALLAYLREEGVRGRRQTVASAIIRNARGYSLAKLLGRPNAELASLGAGLRGRTHHLSEMALVAWLLEVHGQVQRAFFEATGNGDRCNERGLATADEFGTSEVEATRAGCETLIADHGEIGVIYLLALSVGYAHRWTGIREVMAQWAGSTSERPGEACEPRPDGTRTDGTSDTEAPPEHAEDDRLLDAAPLPWSEPAGEAVSKAVEKEVGQEIERNVEKEVEAPATDALPTDTVRHDTGERAAPPSPRLRPVPEPQLTLLDDLLTRTILTAWAGNDHALSRTELFVLLDEVVHVNTERRRSNFHLGFADALFGEPWRQQLSGRSEERRAWYAAGYVTGVARRGDSAQVTACFEEQEDARLLATRPWPPFEVAADALLPALAESERFDALARMAPVAILVSESALRLMGEQGRLALLRRDPGMALAFLVPTEAGVARRLALRDAGTSPDGVARLVRLQLDLRRRLAHAYRLTGATETASALLEALLEHEGDADIRGMIRTDLALVRAGFRELAELLVPDDHAHHADLAAQFDDVQSLLDEAAAREASPSAHAAYVAGVVAMLRGDWPAAAAQLRVALDAFEARPLVYTGRGLLRNARLYTATAELLALEDAEMARRATGRLRDLVVAGERPPRCLALELITNGLLVDQTLGESLMDALRDRQVVALDDLTSAPGIGVHPTVALAMATAALDAGRPLSTRVDLAYRALPVLVERGDADRVEGLLAVLEDGAADGVCTDRFLALLDGQRAHWELCWDRVEAKWSAIRVHLASGNALRARACVQEAFFAVIGNADYRHDWEGEAGELLDALRRCGGAEADVVALQTHLPARVATEPAPRIRPQARHRILVVGGNEVQRRYVDDLRASLAAEFGDTVQVICHQTGMTSTWNRELEDVERLLPRVDAVVFSRFIRTTFGRNLRRQLGTRPWRTCGSAGMGRMRTLVVELAGELERRSAGQAPGGGRS